MAGWLSLTSGGGGAIAEHAVITMTTFLFPPVALIVFLVVLLATFGKSLGLRERYIRTLMLIFEWGARQIKVNEQQQERAQRRESQDANDDDISPRRSSAESDDSGEADLQRISGGGGGDGQRSSVNSNSSIASVSNAPASGLRRRHGSGQNIIERDTLITDPHFDDESLEAARTRGWAVVRDSLHFVKAGIEAIIEDDVTSRFEAEQLASWNMLTRTSIRFYQFVNWKLTLLWGIGWILRYVVLLPLRVTLFAIGLIWMVSSTAIVGLVPESAFKRRLNREVMLISHRILSRSLTAVVQFHDRQNQAKNGGICVANHTSPIDVAILSTDNVYALIGQSHGGLLGLMQRSLSRASSHIWFERSEAKDRSAVANALRKHVDDPNKLPILIFPEGTCINNTSVMQFKKGSFEIGRTIYPIAMKYESRFGDPFWNSSQQSMVEYLFRIMTSWAIICQVWYLPPMQRQEGEDAIEFAARVKREIARKGGLIDLEWDGQLKRQRVPKKLVAEQQQKYYTTRLSRFTSTSEGVQLLAQTSSSTTTSSSTSTGGAAGKDAATQPVPAGAQAGSLDDGSMMIGNLCPSPPSGYVSLEELPDDVIVSTSEEEDDDDDDDDEDVTATSDAENGENVLMADDEAKLTGQKETAAKKKKLRKSSGGGDGGAVRFCCDEEEDEEEDTREAGKERRPRVLVFATSAARAAAARRKRAQLSASARISEHPDE